MKIGCCTGLSKETALGLKAAGADYMEGGFASLSKMTMEEVRALADDIATVGMTVPAMNLMFSSEIKLTGEHVDYPLIDRYLEETLDKAAVLGVKKVVFGSSGPRSVPEGFAYEKAFDQLIELCAKHIAPAFEKRGMTCCVEPLNRRECNILTTCKETFGLVKAVERPGVRLLVDLYHFDLEGESLATLPDYKGYLGHVHIASAKNSRAIPAPGDGEDYAAFFAALHAAGYDGEVSLEGSAPDLRTPEGQQAVKESVEYLRKMAEIK